MQRPFSEKDLENFYIERLGSISSRKELEEALKEGRVNLELNLDDFISPKRREEILRDNPDVIEIAGVKCPVQYSYDEGKFIASAKIPVAIVLKLETMPTLPSGRPLILKVIREEGKDYVHFSGANLEELKQKSKQLLIEEQWSKWQKSEQAPKEQYLENFNLLGELPDLPEPIQYGIDPETNQPLLSYPAIVVAEVSSKGVNCVIKYFPSREKAEQAQQKILEMMNKAKEEQRKKEERECLVALAKAEFEKVKKLFNSIGSNYKDYGLSYDQKKKIDNKLDEAERKLEWNPKEALDLLEDIDKQLMQAFEYKKQKDLAKEKAIKAISEYYSNCPLCGQAIKDDMCTNPEHNLDIIDFEINKEGEEIGPAILSQIVTDEGKIVAQMRVCHSDGEERRFRGDVYLVKGSELDEDGWGGEPFKSLHFEDFKRILTLEQAKERKVKIEAIRRAKEKERYQEQLDYAWQQVKEGNWRYGSFIKGKHPKTNEDQWERTIRKEGRTIKYIVDKWDRQPTSENLSYFYREHRILVDTPKFRLIVVRLESPFPEDKPEELKAT